MENESPLIRDSIQVVKEWLSKLPQEIFTFLEDKNPPYEYFYEIQITPKNPQASPIAIGIRLDESFDIQIGQMIGFNETILNIDLIKEILEAVRLGHLKEQIWEWRGKVLKSKGELSFSHQIMWRNLNFRKPEFANKWFANRSNVLALFLPCKRRLIAYQPW